jgi:hypothetical protein
MKNPIGCCGAWPCCALAAGGTTVNASSANVACMPIDRLIMLPSVSEGDP